MMRAKFWKTAVKAFALVAVLVVGGASATWASEQGSQGASKAGTTTSADTAPMPVRILEKEAIVNAPLDEVWAAWTTEGGLASFFAPESNIELHPGGAYELFMSGKDTQDKQGRSGTQGCKLLSYQPHEMLSFEWNFPPSIESLRYSDAKTHVVLWFDDLGDGRTRVRFGQLGWQDGDDWQKGYDYFDKAWSWVMGSLQEKLGGDDGADAETNGARTADASNETRKTWTEDGVTITTVDGPYKRQEFEIEIDRPVADVWRALATTEGMAAWGPKDANIELTPWGAYAIWPGATNKVLSYWPERMLSVSGSAPEQFPEVRKGGTWGVYFFEPAGADKTKLRLVGLGWAGHDNDEWNGAWEYFLKANPQYLRMLAKSLKQ